MLNKLTQKTKATIDHFLYGMLFQRVQSVMAERHGLSVSVYFAAKQEAESEGK